MLFTYWSLIDREHSFCSSAQDCLFHFTNRSAVFYQVYTKDSNASDILDRARQDVRGHTQSFDFFSPTWVLVVTWLRLRPKVQSVEDVKEDIVSPPKYNKCKVFVGEEWFRGLRFFHLIQYSPYFLLHIEQKLKLTCYKI